MSEETRLMISLNNAIAYSYVLGWYAGRDGKADDSGKIQATKDIKEMHPNVVLACNAHKKLLKVSQFVVDAYGPKGITAFQRNAFLRCAKEYDAAVAAIAAATP